MSVKVEIDPLKKYPNALPDRIFAAAGYIPGWLTDPHFEQFNAIETIKMNYPYWSGDSLKQAKLDEEGIFTYPGDPPFYPILKIERNGEIIYQYQHAFIAIVDKNENVTITRCD